MNNSTARVSGLICSSKYQMVHKNVNRQLVIVIPQQHEFDSTCTNHPKQRCGAMIGLNPAWKWVLIGGSYRRCSDDCQWDKASVLRDEELCNSAG